MIDHDYQSVLDICDEFTRSPTALLCAIICIIYESVDLPR